MSKESITFLLEDDIIKKIQKDADENYDGNFSMALRQILKTWAEKNDNLS